MHTDPPRPGTPLTGADRKELRELLAAVCLEDASTAQWDRVNQLLLKSEDARRCATQFLRDEVLLRHRFGLFDRVAAYSSHATRDAPAKSEPPLASKDAARRRATRLSLLAAVAASLAFAAFLLPGRAPAPTTEPQAARRQVVGAVLAAQGPGQEVGGRARSLRVGDTIAKEQGVFRLRFDCGAEVVLKAPARLEILSPMRALLHRGTLTAKVSETAHGFRIDTANSKITDLGTEFGVSVDEAGATNTVVFSGKVALQYAGQQQKDISAPAPMVPKSTADLLGEGRLLSDGEGIRISKSGEAHRLVMIHDADYPRGIAPRVESAGRRVIVDVSDNLRDSNTTKCYRISEGGFAEDARAFVDRGYQWNGVSKQHGLPPMLRGADYVLPFCDDKVYESIRLTVTLGRAARLFVLLDNRLEIPAWLVRDFTDTGYDVAIDENAYSSERSWVATGTGPGESLDRTCSVWAKDVAEPSEVVLGGITPPSAWSVMYGIAATALEQTIDPPEDSIADHQPRLGAGLTHPGILPKPLAAAAWERADTFDNVTLSSPAADDAASWRSGVRFKARTLGGRLPPHPDTPLLPGGVAPALNDGLLSRDDDDLDRNFWYNDHGRFTVSLAEPTPITSIDTFSWHKWGRSLQYFTVWGSNEVELPPVDFEQSAQSEGWEFVGLVDTRLLNPGGVHTSRLTNPGGPLGPYRHLLWIVERSAQSTFFTEIDVHAAEQQAESVP